MKKLLFATALVATAAAFADGPISAISFEGYTTLPYTFVNGTAEKDETGTDKTPNGPYFFYDGEQDGSSVKAFGGENAAAPNISPRSSYFSGNNEKYLDLSTEGGILWRSINNISQQAGGEGEDTIYGLGTAKSVAAEGLYLDTLVQFTPTEDGGTPELGNQDKLAIWLNVDTNGVTNLMVRAKTYTVDVENSALNAAVVSYAIAASNVTINAGAWYRLTVKAIPNLLKTEDYGKLFGFQIYIDGKLAKNTAGQTFNATEFYEYEMITAEMQTFMAEGSVFASLGALGNATLQGVGFKGSGALDDIVWTEEDPFAGGSGGDDYKVVIDGSDVTITPQEGDLAAVQAAVIAGGGTLDVTDVAAVNAALAAEIGSTGIPRWQALFLGLPPTEAGLESFKIDSISFDEDGKVVVTLPAAVDPKTGRGVDITIKLQSADTPDATSWTDVESATGTTFAPVTPGSTDTKKFYKVVVEFAGSSAQSN